MNTYPRLSRADAIAAIRELERTLATGRIPAPFVEGAHHARAVFPADGGVPVSVGRLNDLHSRMSNALANLPATSRGADRRFDAIAGRVLNDWFQEEGRSIAAHPEIWSYLTIVVLPDLAVRRFGPGTDGSLPVDRFLSGRRNVFHRDYLRSWILGPLLDDPDLEVYEDELVGLVDRSLSADHRLAHRVAWNLVRLADDGEARRHTARVSFRELQFELRVTDLASLSDHDMESIVDGIFARNRAAAPRRS